MPCAPSLKPSSLSGSTSPLKKAAAAQPRAMMASAGQNGDGVARSGSMFALGAVADEQKTRHRFVMPGGNEQQQIDAALASRSLIRDARMRLRTAAPSIMPGVVSTTAHVMFAGRSTGVRQTPRGGTHLTIQRAGAANRRPSRVCRRQRLSESQDGIGGGENQTPFANRTRKNPPTRLPELTVSSFFPC